MSAALTLWRVVRKLLGPEAAAYDDDTDAADIIAAIRRKHRDELVAAVDAERERVANIVGCRIIDREFRDDQLMRDIRIAWDRLATETDPELAAVDREIIMAAVEQLAEPLIPEQEREFHS